MLLSLLTACDGVINYVESGSDSVELTANGINVSVPIRFHVLALASGSVNELVEDPGARADMAWPAKLRLWRDVVLGIQQMHLRGVAHRDLKAENCLLLVRGQTTAVKIADFGRAKDLNTLPSRTLGSYVAGRGDLRFAPPEFLFLQGGSLARDFIAADHYGLGSILAELISGHPMSAVVLGDPGGVIRQAQHDRAAGYQRNLAGLAVPYRTAISDMLTLTPASIREDLSVLLSRLCHPVPEQRLEGSPYSRDRAARDPLSWVIRRTDIMIRRLERDARSERRRNQKARIAA
nr:hypothetical protein GCM10017544_03490 [Microbacterium imperiale]